MTITLISIGVAVVNPVDKGCIVTDAACLAVSEIISGQNGEECEFWTADKGLLFNKQQEKVCKAAGRLISRK